MKTKHPHDDYLTAAIGAVALVFFILTSWIGLWILAILMEG